MYTIRPLLVGEFPRFELSIFVLGLEPGTKVRAPCIVWLIEGEQGEKVLVDTGPHAADAPTAHYHNKLEQREEQKLDRALKAAGVEPEEINTVLFTHLHWDHCYHPSRLPNARFYVQAQELAYAVAPIPWHRSAFESGIPEGNPPWFEVFNRITPVDGDFEVLPGVVYHLLPGHTPGSAGITVKTRQGVYCIAGDTVPRMENWEGNAKQRHIPSALVTDTIAYYKSFQRMEQLADRVLPSHDPRAFDQAIYP